MRSAWRVAGTSVAGPRHAAAGESCQDRHRVHVTERGALIAVVSDGAGSAVHGGEGAAILCEVLVERLNWFLLTRRPTPSRALLAGACRAVRDAVAEARERAAALAEERGTSLNAFHATLVGAVMQPGLGGLFFHIGDGAALAIADDQRWKMSAPSNGEYADTTYFFTQSDWRRHLRFATIDAEYDTIFVMSDGVTDLALQQRGRDPQPYLPFFEPIGRFLAGASRDEGEQALTATLDSEAVRERTTDDKTLVWAQAAR